MASMNISVPDSMREWVQRRIESGDYASVSDYVRDLIRRDQNAEARQLSSTTSVGQSRRVELRAGLSQPKTCLCGSRISCGGWRADWASEDASSPGSPKPTSQRLPSILPRTVRRPRYVSSTNCDSIAAN